MPTVPYTFVAGTVIDPAEVNANFDVLNDCLDAAGGEVSGDILPNTTNSRHLGSVSRAWASVVSFIVGLMDTDGSHRLALKAGSNLTANRDLTFVTGDASRTLTLGADSSIGGTAYVAGGTDVAIADGGTGASLTDPNADRLMFWDDSDNGVRWLTPGTNLAITGTTINATGGVTITGTDNRLVRVDGTTAIQSSAVTLDDSGNLSGVVDMDFDTTAVMTQTAKSSSTIYQAASDGLLNVVINATSPGGTGDVEVRTDTNATPTTVCGRTSAANNYQSLCVPVKKGHYYRTVVNTNTGTVGVTILWTSLGTSG